MPPRPDDYGSVPEEEAARPSTDPTWRFPVLVGLLKDTADAPGSPLHAIKDHTDISEFLGTDLDSPVVTAGTVLLAIGSLAGVFGAVRSDRTRGVRPATDERTRQEALRHQEAALAAGLPEGHWMGLDASSYRRLLAMDPLTVAFWMGSDLEDVTRWQTGRTLQDDLAEGRIASGSTEDQDWIMERRPTSEPMAEKDALAATVEN